MRLGCERSHWGPMVRALPPAFLLIAFSLGTALGAASCGGSRATPTESDMATCSNARDDDGDGLVDCHDPACGIFSFCNAHDGGVDAAAASDANVDAGDGGTCGRPLDIVLTVDVSTSMTGELAAIGDGISHLWDVAHEVSADPRISLVVFVDDVLAVDGTPPFAADGGCMPFTNVEDLRTQLGAWQTFCASNQSPVSHLPNQDCAENSLDAIVAATMCPLRDGSRRVLVHVTDDTFVERPAVLSGEWGGGVVVQFNYLEATTALVDRGFRVGVFGETGVGDDCGAGRSPDVGRGFSGPFGSMSSLPEVTNGRFWDLREVRAGRLDMASEIESWLRQIACE